MRDIHLALTEDTYEKIWTIIKRRYINPTRKFHIVLNEALKEYIERHKEEPTRRVRDVDVPQLASLQMVHTRIHDQIFEGIWTIVKRRYVSPIKKFHISLNEALAEYIERHKEELEG